MLTLSTLCYYENTRLILLLKVSLSDEELQDLHQRLDRARYGEDLVDTQFQYGFPVRCVRNILRLTEWIEYPQNLVVFTKNHNICREMRKIVKYWRNTYDWRKQEDELNKFPQFKTKIEGIDIHFLRVKPKSGRTGDEIYIEMHIM